MNDAREAKVMSRAERVMPDWKEPKPRRAICSEIRSGTFAERAIMAKRKAMLLRRFIGNLPKPNISNIKPSGMPPIDMIRKSLCSS